MIKHFMLGVLAWLFAAFSIAWAYGPSQSDWTMNVGGGFFVAPNFPGSDKYEFRFVPYGDLTYKDVLFVNPATGAGVQHKLDNGVTVGARVLYDFGRRDHSAIKGVGQVGGSLDGGGFVHYDWLAWRASFFAQTAMAGPQGHQGTYGDVRLAYRQRLWHRLILMPNINVNWADNNYMQSYYGVSSKGSARSGLPVYNAQAGIETVRVNLSAFWLFTPKWSAFMTGSWGYYLDNLADSPIVQQRSQWRSMIGFSYSFDPTAVLGQS